jgi:transcriptional regulator with XRE-family HTH domain
MFTHPQQGIGQDDVVKLRQAAGLYLRGLREAAGLSQRAFAKEVGIEHYTFISQIESGRGRVPPAQMGEWARVLKVAPRVFAVNMMRYYDPVTFELIFTDDLVKQITEEGAGNGSALEARIAKLEQLMAGR